MSGSGKGKKVEMPMDRIEVLEREIEMLKKKKAFLEKQIAEQIANANKCEKAGQKAKAVECMERKKSLEGDLAKCASTIKENENEIDVLTHEIYDSLARPMGVEAYGFIDEDELEDELRALMEDAEEVAGNEKSNGMRNVK